MPYAIFSKDKPNSLQLRNDTRVAHREFLATQMALMIGAGPLMDDDGKGGVGSLTILDTEDRDVATRFAEADPYFRIGLFDSVTICRWKQTIRDGERVAT
jgi:uncharacterized protein YciI